MNLLSLFVRSGEVEEYEEGEKIFVEGDPGKVMYVVLEGEVDIKVRGQTIYTAQPGEIIGEMALSVG